MILTGWSMTFLIPIVFSELEPPFLLSFIPLSESRILSLFFYASANCSPYLVLLAILVASRMFRLGPSARFLLGSGNLAFRRNLRTSPWLTVKPRGFTSPRETLVSVLCHEGLHQNNAHNKIIPSRLLSSRNQPSCASPSLLGSNLLAPAHSSS
jgi:hypothetical protein